MAQGIDFLAVAQKKAPGKVQTSLWLKKGSVILLAGYCLLVGVVFVYSIFLKTETEEVATQITKKQEEISSFKKIETLQTILKERLSNLNKYFSEPKSDFSQLLTYFESIAPEGIIIDQINFVGGGKISLSGNAVNSLVLSSLLETLNQPEQTSSFSEIVLGSVSRQKEGVYQFNLTFTLNEEK